MKLQISPAATNEIAIGMKISDLIALSYGTRSAITARIRPNTNTKPV